MTVCTRLMTLCLTLNSEIGRHDRPQSLGSEVFRRSSTYYFRYASLLLKPSLLKILRHLTPSNFGVQVRSRYDDVRTPREFSRLPAVVGFSQKSLAWGSSFAIAQVIRE